MNSLTYSQSGVNYSVMDPLKQLAQIQGKKTGHQLKTAGFSEVGASRGESAYVVDAGNHYLAFVQEGLGTKNLVADEMQKITGKSYYDSIAQDTVAMIVNDLITVGAKPLTILAYWAVGSSSWFSNQARNNDLVVGWSHACEKAGACWGGGETPTLSGIINKKTIDLAGSAVGIVKPKQRLVLGEKLQAGDVIVAFESSGIHANGVTLARKLAEKLPDGYATKMDSGPFDSAQGKQMYGEVLLTPTIIYAKLVHDLLDAGVDIHYMVNITGHGWRKLMRSSQLFTYRITQLPPVPEVFRLIQEKGPVSKEEMYANFNMGAGYAIFVPGNFVTTIKDIASQNNIKTYEVGVVEAGEKQVILEPKKITFKADSLQVKAS